MAEIRTDNTNGQIRSLLGDHESIFCGEDYMQVSKIMFKIILSYAFVRGDTAHSQFDHGDLLYNFV